MEVRKRIIDVNGGLHEMDGTASYVDLQEISKEMRKATHHAQLSWQDVDGNLQEINWQTHPEYLKVLECGCDLIDKLEKDRVDRSDIVVMLDELHSAFRYYRKLWKSPAKGEQGPKAIGY